MLGTMKCSRRQGALLDTSWQLLVMLSWKITAASDVEDEKQGNTGCWLCVPRQYNILNQADYEPVVSGSCLRVNSVFVKAPYSINNHIWTVFRVTRMYANAMLTSNLWLSWARKNFSARSRSVTCVIMHLSAIYLQFKNQTTPNPSGHDEHIEVLKNNSNMRHSIADHNVHCYNAMRNHPRCYENFILGLIFDYKCNRAHHSG